MNMTAEAGQLQQFDDMAATKDDWELPTIFCKVGMVPHIKTAANRFPPTPGQGSPH